MALSQWWSFTDGCVDTDREQAGVYQLGDANEKVVYVGSTNNLKRRLKEHLGEATTSCIKKNAKRYQLEYTEDYEKREQELYDAHVRKYGEKPLCNTLRP